MIYRIGELSRDRLRFWLAWAPDTLHGLWLEPGKGLRAALKVPVNLGFIHEKVDAEAEVSLAALDGALLIRVDEVRQKELGSSRLPHGAWAPIIRKMLGDIAVKLPVYLSLGVLPEGDGGLLRWDGARVASVLIGADEIRVELR